MKFLKGAVFGMASAAAIIMAYSGTEMIMNNKRKIMKAGKKAIRKLENKIM